MVSEVIVSGNSLTLGAAGYGMVTLLITVLVAGRALTSSGVYRGTKHVPDRDGEFS